MAEALIFWIAMAAFNIPILVVSIAVPFLASLRGALKEKGPDGPMESTSYSRITGLFGAVVVTSFFWAIGNVVLWTLFTRPDQVEKTIDGVWKFFLLGAALFLPYAFNQLRAIFLDVRNPPAEAAAAPAPRALAPAVVQPAAAGVVPLRNSGQVSGS